MTIGELAAESGVTPSIIRYWERIGGLPQPVRAKGQRRYAPDAVHRLALLQLAQACGFRLEEMRHLVRTPLYTEPDGGDPTRRLICEPLSAGE